MSVMKSVGVHLILTVAAGTTALTLWTKEEEAVKAVMGEVQVWPGTPEQIESLSYEGEGVKVRMEPKRDELGRWYVVHLNQQKKRASPPANPHAPAPEPAESKDEDVGKWVQSKFISVTEAGTLSETLAPLKALRAIGRVGKEREEEFGFDKPEGTLSVTIAGKQHKLSVGGLTPGGGDRYVRLSGSQEAYAIPGEALRGFMNPESRLMETRLHGFEMDEVKRIKVSSGKESRELLRLTDKAGGWAALDKPLEQDETASNWMNKVYRFRVSEYLGAEPKQLGPESLVVRIEYLDGTSTLGFMELFKLPATPDADKDGRYAVRTEHTRWYAEVLASVAKQVERDLHSVLGGGQPPSE